MVRRLSHFWYGCLLIQLHGFSPERFFNLCAANHIEIWKLIYSGNDYQFYMTVKDYRRIQPFVRKSKVRLKILKKFGLPFFLYRNRKRKPYFIGLFSFFALLYLMSLFIWDISFEGNSTYTYDTLLKFFETQNIHYGMMKSKVQCEELESAIRNEFSEITWVSARVSGTRLLVKIKENEVLSQIPEKDESICDLVAEKSGTVVSMVVRQGVPMVQIGDQVEPGQVLVSGLVPVTNDGGEVVSYHTVHSDADIIARTDQEYRKEFPNLHAVETETGKTKHGIYLKLFDYSLVLLMPETKGRTWKLITEENQLKLFQNFYLPIYAGKISGKEYISYEREYRSEELSAMAEQYQNQVIENLMEKGVQIIQNNVKILNSESKCQLVVTLLTEERIGETKRISEPEETIESDERNGDHN